MNHNNHIRSTAGFTLIELLTVIAIISILAAVILPGIRAGIDKAKVAQAVSHIKQVESAMVVYSNDIEIMPKMKCRELCTDTSTGAQNLDFLKHNVSSNPKWNGPYYDLVGSRHPWGGRIGVNVGCDTGDVFIALDDDTPNTFDNGAQIPQAQMQDIDAQIDDGNLATGRVYGNGNQGTPVGELVIRLPDYDDQWVALSGACP